MMNDPFFGSLINDGFGRVQVSGGDLRTACRGQQTDFFHNILNACFDRPIAQTLFLILQIPFYRRFMICQCCTPLRWFLKKINAIDT